MTTQAVTSQHEKEIPEKKDNFIGLKTSRKARIKALAKKHGVSVSGLLDGYVALGFVVDRYMGPNSQLVIRNSADGGADILIPLDELIR